jgi:AraC-like DNA-binding protein
MSSTGLAIDRASEETRSRVSARFFRHPNELCTPGHQHPSAQLMLLTAGFVTIRTPTARHVLPPHLFVFLPPNIDHSVGSSGDVEGFHVCLTREFDGVMPPRPFPFEGSRLLLEIVKRLWQCQLDGTEVSSECNLVRALMDELTNALESKFTLQMPTDVRLLDMASEILRYPAKSRSLQQWSAQAGIPERTIFRRFKEETGMSFNLWVQHARMMTAATQLRNGASVKQVAAIVGYNSVSSFIKSFMRVTGITPGTFRQQEYASRCG